MILICGSRRTGKTTALCEALVNAARESDDRSLLIVDTQMLMNYTVNLLKSRGWRKFVHVDVWECPDLLDGWAQPAVGFDEPPPGYIARMGHMGITHITHMTVCTPTPLATVEIGDWVS